MERASCAGCGADYDPDLVPEDGRCAAPACGGRLRVPLPWRDLLTVVAGAASVLAAVGAMASLSWLGNLDPTWKVCSGVAAAAGVLGLLLFRKGRPVALRGAALSLGGLGLAYPPFIAMTLLVIGAVAAILFMGVTETRGVRNNQRRAERLAGL